MAREPYKDEWYLHLPDPEFLLTKLFSFGIWDEVPSVTVGLSFPNLLPNHNYLSCGEKVEEEKNKRP